MKQHEFQEKLKEVIREFDAARFSVASSIQQIEHGNALLIPHNSPFSPRDLRSCAAQLEATYTMRLFAQFEKALRDYWLALKSRITRVQMEVLITRIAARIGATADILLHVQAVRNFRNEIAHHGITTPNIPINECKSHLAKFMSLLPREW